jgi:hypothetical protein
MIVHGRPRRLYVLVLVCVRTETTGYGVTIALLLTKSGREREGGSGQQFPRYSICQASHPVRCGQQVPGTLARGITSRSFELGWPERVWHRWIPERLRDPVKVGSDDRDDILRLARKEETFFISEVYKDRDKPPTSRACPSETHRFSDSPSVQRSRSIAKASRCRKKTSCYDSQREEGSFSSRG